MKQLQGKELVLKSLYIATKAHEGQFRRDNETPYINHPITVANNSNNYITKSIALLHDVVEDTTISGEYLLKQGIPLFIVDAVKLLTKKKSEKYLDYILRVRQNPLAILVKIQDIKHNYPTSSKSKQEKYDMALYILGDQ